MKKRESNIFLTKAQKEEAKTLLSNHLEEYFDINISGLEGELLLEFISENIGKHYYNKAILDSISLMKEKAEDLYLLMEDENI